jgi:hypothetical protein
MTTDRIAALDASLASYLGEDWHARARAERAAEIARFETLRRDLLTVLRDVGVTRIVLDYEGGNDNGCIAGRRIEPETAETAIAACTVPTPSQAWDAEAQGWTTVLKDTPILGAVEDLLIHELGRSVGNWYDGDIETSGEIVWTIGPDNDAITGEHTTVLRSLETEDWSADPDDDDVTVEDTAAAPAAPGAGG